MKILVVDDDKDIRELLDRTLKKWNHEVITTSDGQLAYEILKNNEDIHIVISDWLMPIMNGLELCKKIRNSNFPNYIYIILLTAKDSKRDLIEGMKAGADDFMSKPFVKGELDVRIRAGERICKLEKKLEEQNKILIDSNIKLRKAYDIIRDDLDIAGKIQRTLLPDTKGNINGLKFDWLFLPCSFVAGDIFNFFNLDDKNICFYLLDVAGHGIPAAMMSVSLSKFISASIQLNFLDNSNKNILYSTSNYVSLLNKQFQAENDSMQYFTMIYGLINTKNGSVKLTQAGHPSPIYLKNGNGVSIIGSGGFPVGLIPEVEYEEKEFDLSKGDKLFIYSDGITECNNEHKEQFSEKRLINFIKDTSSLSLNNFILELNDYLHKWRGKSEFEDDVTLLGIEI